MRRALLIALAAVASLAVPAFGQGVSVNGQNPQLPASLGSLGGLKVECLIGCGGGAVGADVNISGVGGVAVGAGGLPVTFANTTIGISGSVAVTGTFWQATQPVSGTFWQATQPVSHANFANLDAALSTLATSAKQPALVAGRVPVDGSGVTQPVSGTFWQGTQPVSGTFWQAIQPVSGTVAATQSTSPWVDNISQFGGSVVTLGQGTSAASIPVVLASNALPPPDRATTGTIASNGALVAVTSGGTGTTTVAITGTWVGTFVPFGIDGAGAAQALYGLNALTGQPDSTISGNGVWTLPAAGWSSVGLLSTSWTSGTASIGLIAGVQSNVVALGRSLPTGVNSIGQVTANAGLNLNTSALALETTQIALNALVSSMQQTLASGTAMVTVPLVGPGPARTLRSPFACNALRKLGCS